MAEFKPVVMVKDDQTRLVGSAVEQVNLEARGFEVQKDAPKALAQGTSPAKQS